MDLLEEHEKRLVPDQEEPKDPFQALDFLAAQGDFKPWSCMLERAIDAYDPSQGSAQINRGGEFLLYVKTSDDAREELIRRALSVSTLCKNFDFICHLVEEYSLVPQHLEHVLYFAVTSGNLKTAEIALEKGAAPTNEKLLEHSARLGNKEMIRLLVKHGANVWEYGQRGAQEHPEIRRFFSRRLAGIEAEL